MKPHMISYLVIAAIAISCSSGKKTASGDHHLIDSSAVSRDSVAIREGSSFETAVVINKKSESEGIHAEYEWIRDHYSDYKVVRQSLANHKKKPYDIITIQFSDERKEDIYFDISKFFK